MLKILFLQIKIILSNIYILQKLYTFYIFFFYQKKKLPYQLSDSKIKFEKPKKKVIIFPLIETTHIQNFFLMLLAKILVIKGYNAIILVCDQFLKGCEIKDFKKKNHINPCFKCKFNQKKVFPFFKLTTIKLSDFYSKKLDLKINKVLKRYKKNNYSFSHKDKFFYLNKTIDESVTRYYYGDVYAKNKDKNHSDIVFSHCKTVIQMTEICKIIDSKYQPLAIVSLMTSYSSWFPFFYHFKKDNRFRQLHLSDKDYVFDHFNFFPATKHFYGFLKLRKNRNLNKIEKIEINRFLKKKFRLKNNKKSFIESFLKLDKTKKNIFIFPNVFWDIGLSDRGHLFESVLEWLFYTIDLLKNNPKYHIYIKPHPNEFNEDAFFSPGVEKLIKKKYGNSIKNLSFIKKTTKVSSYDLRQVIDLALVFNGTLHLEFSLLGVPVVATGNSTISGIGFDKQVKSLTCYKEIFTKKNYDFRKFVIKDKDRLLTFAYFWFIKIKFKWEKKNYYAEVFNRFKHFGFKSLNDCNFNTSQTKRFVDYITKGKVKIK